MAFIYELEYTVHSVIEDMDESGLPAGEPEISVTTVGGFYKQLPCGAEISYSELCEGERIHTTLAVGDNVISLKKRGAIGCDIEFSEGGTHSSVYTVSPYSFDITVRTARIRNELSKDGGVLRINYSMNIGGQQRAVRMKISARPIKR